MTKPTIDGIDLKIEELRDCQDSYETAGTGIGAAPETVMREGIRLEIIDLENEKLLLIEDYANEAKKADA